MTSVETVVGILRDWNFASVWLDDSAMDGGYQVDSSDSVLTGVAEAIVEALGKIADRENA